MKEVDLHKVFFSGDKQERLIDSLKFRKTLYRRMPEAKLIKAHYRSVCLNHLYHRDYSKYSNGKMSLQSLLKKWQLQIAWTPFASFESQFGTGKPPLSVSRFHRNRDNVRGFVLWEKGSPYILFDDPIEILIEGKSNKNLVHLENYYQYKIVGKSMNYLIASNKKARRTIEFSITRAARLIFSEDYNMAAIKELEMPYYFRRFEDMCKNGCLMSGICRENYDSKKWKKDFKCEKRKARHRMELRSLNLTTKVLGEDVKGYPSEKLTKKMKIKKLLPYMENILGGMLTEDDLDSLIEKYCIDE